MHVRSTAGRRGEAACRGSVFLWFLGLLRFPSLCDGSERELDLLSNPTSLWASSEGHIKRESTTMTTIQRWKERDNTSNAPA